MPKINLFQVLDDADSDKAKELAKIQLFAENCNKNWELGNQHPLQLNAANAYKFEGDQILIYKRFTAYLISYMASFLFLAVLLGYLFTNRKIYILI